MKKLLMAVGVLVATVACGAIGMLFHTKSFSPLKAANITTGGTEISVSYCGPFKRQRDIFGGLVKYGEIWRTGANEATTFTTTKALAIGGQVLEAGTYSLWTLPTADSWEIIFNKEYGQWGINFITGKANHDPQFDVLRVSVPAFPSERQFEQFSIQLESLNDNIEMIMFWDDIMVVLPMATQSRKGITQR